MVAHVQVSRWRRNFGSAYACLRNLAVVPGYQQRISRLTLAGRNCAYVRLNARFVQPVRSERFLIAAGVDGSTRFVLCCVALRCVVTTTTDVSRDGRRSVNASSRQFRSGTIGDCASVFQLPIVVDRSPR